MARFEVMTVVDDGYAREDYIIAVTADSAEQAMAKVRMQGDTPLWVIGHLCDCTGPDRMQETPDDAARCAACDGTIGE
jgi:hypothetical protein